MNSSATLSKLASALAKVQSNLPKVKFDKQNKFLNNKYSTLGALIEAAIPVISTEGLSIMQFPTSHEGRVGVRSILMHESGEYIEDTITIVPEASKGLTVNQAAGVTITYLRRYAFAAILGLVSDEDTDGDTTDQKAYETSDKVKEQMKRIWSIDAMETVLAASSGLVTEHMDASQILDMSVLPADAPLKTVESWMKHYVKSQGTTSLAKAAEANEAYQKAKNGGKSK